MSTRSKATKFKSSVSYKGVVTIIVFECVQLMIISYPFMLSTYDYLISFYSDQKRKADTDHDEDKKVQKTSSKHFSRKKTTKFLKSGPLDKSNAVSIVVQEMQGGIYTAYFQFKTHGYYVRPIDEAWRQTVERVQGEPKALYNTSPNTLSQEFGVDCWCN